MKKELEKIIKEFLDKHDDLSVEEYKFRELGELRRKYDKDRFDKDKNRPEVEDELIEGVMIFFKKQGIDFSKDMKLRKLGEELEEMIKRQF